MYRMYFYHQEQVSPILMRIKLTRRKGTLITVLHSLGLQVGIKLQRVLETQGLLSFDLQYDMLASS